MIQDRRKAAVRWASASDVVWMQNVGTNIGDISRLHSAFHGAPFRSRQVSAYFTCLLPEADARLEVAA